MTNTATPVLQQERADILDALRGFALFGVLLDNMFAFSGWGNFTQPYRESLATWPADGILGLLELSFVHGKFYSLFSLLFGIGFSIILIRNQQKGINPLKIFFRRLFILLLIGAGHMFLLWDGDILFLYALIGFLLPMFRKCSDKTLLVWAVILIASPILIDCIKVLLNVKTGVFLETIAAGIDRKTGLPADDNWRQYLFKDGSGWSEWRNWQASGWLYRYAYIIESNRIPKVLGMFLFGLYAGRKMMYSNPEQYTTLFKKLRKWGFIIGIPGSIAMAVFEIDGASVPDAKGLFDTLFYAISVVPLSLAYVSVICLFWIKTKGNNKLKLLTPVGRMALTNYLMQTMLGITLFYGVGFGLGGNIGPVVFFPIAIGVYLVQIGFCHLWFRYYSYGPMEWVWRMLTYRKKLNILKR